MDNSIDLRKIYTKQNGSGYEFNYSEDNEEDFDTFLDETLEFFKEMREQVRQMREKKSSSYK